MDYKNITVAQYYKILDVLKDYEEPIEIQIGLIDAVFGLDANALSLPEFKEKSEQLSFLNTPYKPKKMKSCYLIEGQKFNTITDFSKVTTAQFIDYQTLLKVDPRKLILNCLFIKDGEAYGDNDYSDLLYNHLSLDIYLDVLDSFKKCFIKLQKDTLNSSLKKTKRLMKRTKNREEKMILLKQIIEMKQAMILMDDYQ